MTPENWVFFAVTYDGTITANNLTYYFGNASQEATNDLTLTYNQGVIAQTGPLTIGNQNTVGGNPSKAGGEPNGSQWRGLMDEIKIYNKVLTLEEIRAAQMSPSLPPHLLWTTQTNNLILSWEGAFQLQSRTNLASGSWANVTTLTNVSGTIRSIGLPPSGPSKFFRLLY